MAEYLSDDEVFGATDGYLPEDQVFGSSPPAEGGLAASFKSAVGQTIKGVGQAAADFIPGVSQANPVSTYGQSVIDANPTAINKLSDVVDKPVTAVKEAVGNVAPSVAGALGIRALGQGITAAAPYATAINPLLGGLTAIAGQAISWGGPIAMAALPSYGGIRGEQIEKDPTATTSGADKAVAALGAATVGAIEQKFGPQDWATKLVTKEGRDQLAKMMASTTLKGAVVKGAGKGALIEGAEELVQNPVEQIAAYDNPLTKESLEETALGGVMGALGGGVAGGAFGGGARRSPAAVDKVQEQLLNNLLKDTNVSVTDGKASFMVGDQQVTVDPIELGNRLAAGETLATMPQDFLFGERGLARPAAPAVAGTDLDRATSDIDWEQQAQAAQARNQAANNQDYDAQIARAEALGMRDPRSIAIDQDIKSYSPDVPLGMRRLAQPAPAAVAETNLEQATSDIEWEQQQSEALARNQSANTVETKRNFLGTAAPELGNADEVALREYTPEPPPADKSIIANLSGRPIATERATLGAIKREGEDPANYDVVPVKDGFIAVRKPDAPQASTVEPASGTGVAASSPRGAASLDNRSITDLSPQVMEAASAEAQGRTQTPAQGAGNPAAELGSVNPAQAAQVVTNPEVSTPGAGAATPPASKISFVNQQAYDNYLATNNLKPEGVSTSVSPEGVITVDPAAPVFTAQTKGAALGYISRNKLQATHEVVTRADGGADVVLKAPETYESLQAKTAKGEVQEITATQLFSSIAKAPSEVTRNLGTLLHQFTPQSKLANIKVVIDPNAKSASYRPSTRTVTVKDLNQFETSLHEIVHSVTVAELAANPGMQKRLKQVMLQARREAIKQGLISEQQMKEIEAAGGSKAFKNKFPAGTLSGVENIAYAFTNEKEFLAQAFSSPQVQQFLESVQINNGGKLRSAWDALVEKVMQVLGIDVKHKTAFSEAIKITAQLAGQEASSTSTTSQQVSAEQKSYDPDTAEATFVQKGIEGKTTTEAIQFLVDNAPSASYMLIAKKVKDAINKLKGAGVKFDFKVVHVGDQVPRSLLGSRGISSTDFKGGISNTIWLNGADVTGKVGMSYETVLHELVHAASQAAIFLGNRKASAGSSIAKSTADLFVVTNQIVKHFNNRVRESQAGGPALTEFEQRIYSGATNSVQSVDEILAWTLTNKEMQAYLETIKISKTETLWSKFVSAVRTLLGLPASADTALSEVLRIGEDIFNAPINEIAEANTVFNGGLATAKQATAFQVTSEQVFESLDTALKAGHDRVLQAAQALANPKNKLHEFYLQHADKWLSVLPKSFLGATLGKTVKQLQWSVDHLNEMLSTKTRISDDSYKIYQQAKKVAEKGAGVDAFNDALLKGTYYQMLPWADQYSQDWGRKGANKQEYIKSAQIEWENSGMAKSTGKHYLQAWKEAHAAWAKMDKASKEQALRVIDDLKAMRQRERDNLLAAIEESTKNDPATRAKLMERFNLVFSNIKGIYVPLSRYGNLYLEYTAKDGTREVLHFDSIAERDQAKLTAKANGAKQDSFVEGVIEEHTATHGAVPSELINQVLTSVRANYLTGVDPTDGDAVADAESRAQALVSGINQTFLRWLPDTAALKNSIHRKSTKGASTDMLRSYIDYMLRHASSAAWMEVGKKLEADIQSLAEENRELRKKGDIDLTLRGHILNNERRWLQAIRTRSTNVVSSTISALGTGYYMTSPSTFLVQLTQLPAITLPNLSARFGWGKSSAALGKGFKQAFSKDFTEEAMLADTEVDKVYQALHRRVSEAERTPNRPVGSEWYTQAEKDAMIAKLNYKQKQLLMLREAIAMNLLDISAVHEAQAEAFGKKTSVLGKAFSYAMLPMQHGELGSRKAAALATFDLATQDKKDFFTAMQEIKKTISETLYSYAKEDKGYVLQGSVPTALLQFQTYRINTALRLGLLMWQSVKGETPEVKKAAWKEFKGIAGMSALLGGANGLVFGSLLFGVANLFGGDDDEPWDAKLAMTNWLKETFGETAGDAAMFGLPSLLGVNVSNRIGMANIFGTQTDPPSGLHGAGLAAWYAGNLLGPGFSVAQSWVKGYDQMMNKGNYMRGLEEATPKPIRDALKAYRVGAEGLKDGQGKRLLDDAAIGPDEILMVGLGFTPSEIAAAQTANFTLNKMKTEVSERRGRLVRDAANAIIEGGDTTEVLEAIRKYNERMPGRAISGRDLRPVIRRLVLGDLGETDSTDLMMADQFGIPTYTAGQ